MKTNLEIWLEYHKNPFPKKNCPDVPLLKKLYLENKKGSWAIAKIFGTNQRKALMWIREAGIVLRSRAEASKISLNGFKEMEKHPFWQGENVGYQALHTWVKRRLKKPLVCPRCGKAKRFDLSNNGIYNREFKNWEWLCRGCHLKKDYQNGQRKKI